ncbi:hypothetical protein AALP_AA1G279500 [Arabis alpina]|uniref:Uncharacterized protein n=1 Tax=Arabis alpina TaxID=50452 RepID=A0A087HR45_ARAAL|nr:hypothetical protein AALP_AA1G279500 [Arabis alpina]
MAVPRNSPDVKMEHNEDEINETFDLALFLRKQKSSTRGKRRARKFRPPDPPRSTLSTERATGSGKPPTPTTATTSAASTSVPAPAEPTTAPPSATPTTTPAYTGPATAPASAKLTTVSAPVGPTTVPSSEPRDTSARNTTTVSKGSRLPSPTRTEVLAALPVLPAPLPSDYDAKKEAKGLGRDPLHLLFLALVNNVGQELGDEVEVLKKKLEDETRRTENARTSVKALAVVTHDQTLETYAVSVGVADTSGSLHGGTNSCKAVVVGVDGKFSLIGGVGAEVTRIRIHDVVEGALTVGAPEEMRTDEDSQGPMINTLTEDPVTQVAPPGVDEEIVP